MGGREKFKHHLVRGKAQQSFCLIGPKNHNLEEDVEYMCPAKLFEKRFIGCREEGKPISFSLRRESAILVDIGRGRWILIIW